MRNNIEVTPAEMRDLLAEVGAGGFSCQITYFRDGVPVDTTTMERLTALHRNNMIRATDFGAENSALEAVTR